MGTGHTPTVRRGAHAYRGDQERTEGRSPRDRKKQFGRVKAISIYIDADACPLKQEIYRDAERHALKGHAPANSTSPSSAAPGNRTGCEAAVCRHRMGTNRD